MNNDQINEMRKLKIEYKKARMICNAARIKFSEARQECDHTWDNGKPAFIGKKFYVQCVICERKNARPDPNINGEATKEPHSENRCENG